MLACSRYEQVATPTDHRASSNLLFVFGKRVLMFLLLASAVGMSVCGWVCAAAREGQRGGHRETKAAQRRTNSLFFELYHEYKLFSSPDFSHFHDY